MSVVSFALAVIFIKKIVDLQKLYQIKGVDD